MRGPASNVLERGEEEKEAHMMRFLNDLTAGGVLQYPVHEMTTVVPTVDVAAVAN